MSASKLIHDRRGCDAQSSDGPCSCQPPYPFPRADLPEAIRIGTCTACRHSSRKLYAPRQLIGEPASIQPKWYPVCAYCFPRVSSLADIRTIKQEQPPRQPGSSAKRAYPCIGGPLDGMHAITADFRRAYPHKNPLFHLDAGQYAHLADQYREYNSGYRHGGPSLVFVHVSLLKPAIRPQDR